ncbi:MAG: hypothetical protein FH748_13875 [Balneolaceae bacterium]|nr:hypothetical protein [Balneolaceae bacterium]
MNISTLIEYDSWANKKVWKAIQQASGKQKFSELKKHLAHLFHAQLVWAARIQNSASEINVWPELSMQEIKELMEQSPSMLKHLAEEPEQIIKYANSSGAVFENSVEEILFHIIIHGQHHRAQIAKLLRQAEITPPATDLIFFLR